MTWNRFIEAVLYECRCVLIMSARYWRSVNRIFRQWKRRRCSSDWNTDGCTGGSRHTDQTYWPHLCGFPDARECGRICAGWIILCAFLPITNTIANRKLRVIGWPYAASRNKKKIYSVLSPELDEVIALSLTYGNRNRRYFQLCHCRFQIKRNKLIGFRDDFENSESDAH